MKGWAMRSLTAVFLCTALMLGVSGCVTAQRDAVAAQRLNQLQEDVQVMSKQITDTTQEMGQLAKDMRETVDKGQKGELSAADVAVKIAELTALYDKKAEEVAQFQEKLSSAETVITQLREENKVAWWEIAGTIALGVATAVAGGGWRNASNGVGLLIKAIESGKSQADIKKAVKAANNPTVETAVRKLT